MKFRPSFIFHSYIDEIAGHDFIFRVLLLSMSFFRLFPTGNFHVHDFIQFHLPLAITTTIEHIPSPALSRVASDSAALPSVFLLFIELVQSSSTYT